MSDALLDDPSGACLGLPVDDETGAGGILTAAKHDGFTAVLSAPLTTRVTG